MTMDDYAHMLLISEPLRAPVIQQAIEALHLPAGSRGLDAGCGVGLQALRLAEAVGPQGHVTGLDASSEFLARAAALATQAGLAQRLTFRQGDWAALPYADATFDWAWSVDAAGYAPREPAREVRELARVIRPGGTLAIMLWSSQMLLPGYPSLEARLNATRSGIAPFADGLPPETHSLRALGWLHAAGLANVRAETFVRSVSAPLADDLREAIRVLFDMRWGEAQADLSEADWQAYQRLCRPESEDFILNRPDYYAFLTYSLFCGETPAL